MRVNKETKSVDIERQDLNYILPAYIVSYLFNCQNEDPERITFPLYPSVPHPRKPGVMIPIEYVPPESPVAVEIKEDGSNVAEATEEQIRQLDEKEDEIKRLKEELEGLRAQESKLVESGALAEEASTPAEEVSAARAAFAESVPEEEVTEGLTEDDQQYESAKADQPESDVCPPHWWNEEGQCNICGTTKELEAEAVPPTTPPPVPSVDRQPKQPPGGALPPGTPLDDMQSRNVRLDSMVARDIAPQPDVDEEEEIPADIEKPKE